MRIPIRCQLVILKQTLSTFFFEFFIIIIILYLWTQQRDSQFRFHSHVTRTLSLFLFSFPPSEILTLRHISNSPSLFPLFFFSRQKKSVATKQHSHRERTVHRSVQFNYPPAPLAMVDSGSDFAGIICSICYEPLNPINEDLQSVSICGHVFHELW